MHQYNTSGGLIGGNQAAQLLSNPVSTSALQDLENRLCDVLSRVHSNSAQLRNIADRVCGPCPEPVNGKQDPTPSDPPQLRRLEDLAGYLAASIDDLGNQVTRLSRL